MENRIELGVQVPDFEAQTTQGNIKLSDYKGKWVVLFSHPADFTPVCTTELAEFAKRQKDFDDRNTSIMCISVDSVQSHLAWSKDIERMFNVEVKYPIIADLDKKIAKLYGMIHENSSDTSTVRCVFFIDPEQKLRSVIYYPMQVGRNFDEIIRVIDALQTVDKHKVSTPADWKPGEEVIVPPPLTKEDVQKRLKEEYNIKEWYLSTRRI